MCNVKNEGFTCIEKAEQAAKEIYEIFKSISMLRLRNKPNTSAKVLASRKENCENGNTDN